MDDFLLEGASASEDYLNTLIKIADKYELNRKEYVLEQIPLMLCASSVINYDKYKVKGE